MKTIFKWFKWVAIVFSIALVVVVILAKIDEKKYLGQPVKVVPSVEVAAPKKLFVLVHGYRSDYTNLEQVVEATRQIHSDADIILIDYAANSCSNASCFEVAQAINHLIEERFNKHQYDEIQLVGHSLGALLVRKAYCYGHGRLEDLDDRYATGAKQTWVEKVDRIFLFAGMNRGFPIRNFPDEMSALKRGAIIFGVPFARMIGTCKMIRQIQQGQPFVANLRLQWLELMRDLEKQNKAPLVFQMQGTVDDLVRRNDSRDVAVNNFVWVDIGGTDHANIVKLQGSGFAGTRKKKYQSAISPNDGDVEKLKRNSPNYSVVRDPSVTALVIVLHGIRDSGHWTDQYTEPLREAYEKQNSAGCLEVFNPTYSRLGMGPFLIESRRMSRVRWFMDEYTEQLAKYPNLKEIHFIGHSNGTFVLAKALEQYACLDVDRILLANCVLPKNFNWTRYWNSKRIGRVRNDTGANDWVVGTFPRLFETGLLPFNKDLGSAGFDGFSESHPYLKEVKFLQGEHDAGIHPLNVESIVDFLINDSLDDPPSSIVADEQNRKAEFFWRLPLLGWLLCIVVILVGYALAILFTAFLSLLVRKIRKENTKVPVCSECKKQMNGDNPVEQQNRPDSKCGKKSVPWVYTAATIVYVFAVWYVLESI